MQCNTGLSSTVFGLREFPFSLSEPRSSATKHAAEQSRAAFNLRTLRSHMQHVTPADRECRAELSRARNAKRRVVSLSGATGAVSRLWKREFTQTDT